MKKLGMNHRMNYDSQNAYFVVSEVMKVINFYVKTHTSNPILVMNLSGNRKYLELNENI